MTKPREPRVLYLDIETTPNLGWTWGKYEQTVIQFEKESELLCFVAKWAGGATLVYDRRKGYKRMVKALWALLDRADIVVAHNGDNFDIRKTNAAFLQCGLPPPSPYKTVDTKKVAKRYFFLNSNKLDDLGKLLKLGEKQHTSFDLWLGCMANDPKAWKTMLDYNIQDVILLEKIYLELRPWITNHPSLTAITGVEACPKCGSTDSKISKTRYLSGGAKRVQRLCNKCHGYFSISPRGFVKNE
jgi:uncharacterized protein YprB with RNaseH-like and TPR domain